MSRWTATATALCRAELSNVCFTPQIETINTKVLKIHKVISEREPSNKQTKKNYPAPQLTPDTNQSTQPSSWNRWSTFSKSCWDHTTLRYDASALFWIVRNGKSKISTGILFTWKRTLHSPRGYRISRLRGVYLVTFTNVVTLLPKNN